MKPKNRKINSIIHGSQHLNNLLQTCRQQQEILYTVKKILDQQSASHCISAHYSGQCLKIFTDSSVWASRLRFQIKSLIKKLTEAGIETHKIDVRVIPKSQPDKPLRKKRTALKVSSNTAEHIAQTADSIEDEQLGAALKKLALSVTKSGKS